MADEALELLHRLFTEREVSFEGRHYACRAVEMFPKPRQTPFPIFVGGHNLENVRRAARWGQGWLPGWRPFEAEQDFTTSPPGFVWDARIQMMPLVRVHVRDGYVAGEGAMLGKVGGLITVVDEGGTPEMASSALIRWLGEALWFQTALLPTGPNGEGVRWDAVNESTARATMTDGGTAVSAEFHFAPTGEITRMTAMRYRDVNGTGVLTPFEGQYRTYGRHDGVLIPMAAEVAWLLPEGRFPYWRGRPVAVRYDRDVSP